MRLWLATAGMLAILLGAAADLGAALADDWRPSHVRDQRWVRTGVETAEGVRFVWRQVIYGRPVYRCRQFSFNCGWTRPIAYSRQYLSFGYRPSTSSRSEPPSLPDAKQQVLPGAYLYEGRSVSIIERSGAFTRIVAPGTVARWVRSDLVRKEN